LILDASIQFNLNLVHEDIPGGGVWRQLFFPATTIKNPHPQGDDTRKELDGQAGLGPRVKGEAF
jgi:hypothetical protein